MYSKIILPFETASRSINIQFDIHNHARINSFVPTTSTCEAMKVYLRAALGETDDHSIALIGPYGKGKSFLALTLSEILSTSHIGKLSDLLNRIGQIDSELLVLIDKYRNLNLHLLPVIIEGNFEDLDQALYTSLHNALKRESVKLRLPETEFSSALELFERFEKNDAFSRSDIQTLLNAENMTAEDLKSSLNHFNENGLNLFKRILSKITYGSSLPFLLSGNPIQFYENVVHSLSQAGWDGLFVIFDEFSKAMEGTAAQIAQRLKTIQDLAELANRSSVHEQILFTCITHKSLNLYAAEKNEAVLSSFRAVEGRFKELKLNKDSQESLQLISLSLNRKPGYKRVADAFFQEETASLKMQAQSGIATYDQLAYAAANIYPYVPLAVFLLIQLSELAAQNERTMFTSLSDSAPASFSSFLKNNSEGLYTADLLYDYFEEQIEKVSPFSASLVRKCRSALSLYDDKLGQKILKVIVLLQTVEHDSSFQSSPFFIAALLHEDIEKVYDSLRALEEKELIRSDLFSGLISYPYSSSKEIKSAIALVKAKGFPYDAIEEELYTLSGERYFIPQQYNLRNRILRYFDSKQMELDSFLQFHPNYDDLRNADGLFINLYTDELSPDQKKSTYVALDVIAEKYPLICLRIIEFRWKQFRESLLDLHSAKVALKTIALSDLAFEELQQLIYEQTNLLRQHLYYAFEKSTIIYKKHEALVYETGSRKNTEKALSLLCTDIYSRTPVINNELIVRHQLSDSYSKATRFVTDGIIAGDLEQRIENVSATSPEKTVYRTFFHEKVLREELWPVIYDIEQSILEMVEETQSPSLSSVFAMLCSYPYGIREGVIPPLLAFALASIDRNPVLYFQSRQIELSYNNLLKALKNPNNYSIHLSKDASEEKEFLDQLLRFYGLPSTGSFYKKMDLVLNAIRTSRNRLPMIIREASPANNVLNLEKEYLVFNQKLSKYDVNSYEFLFGFLFNAFHHDAEAAIEFLSSLSDLEIRLDKYIKSLSSQIATVFGGAPTDSIRSAYDAWICAERIVPNSIILEGTANRLNGIMKKAQYDNVELLNQISKTLTGYFIKDWSTDNSTVIIKEINNYISSAESANNSSSSKPLKTHTASTSAHRTQFGQLLMNSIGSSLEEFGSSVTNTEKIEILETLIEQIQSGGF